MSHICMQVETDSYADPFDIDYVYRYIHVDVQCQLSLCLMVWVRDYCSSLHLAYACLV